MKANYSTATKVTNNEKERSTSQLINEIKEKYRGDVSACSFFISSCKAIKFIDLLYISEGRVRFFTCPCLKQGSRKRIKGDKVVRFRHENDMLLIGDSSVREISEAELLKHTLEYAVPFAMAKSRFVPVFIKSKKLGLDFSQFFDGTETITEEKITVEVESAEDEAATLEAVETEDVTVTETEVITAEESTPTPKTEEDLLIEKIIDLDANVLNPLTKFMIDRIMDISTYINDSIIEKVKSFDDCYIYNQGLCEKQIEAAKLAASTASASEKIDKFIIALAKISADLKNQSEEAKNEEYFLKKSLEKATEKVNNFYNEINNELSRIETECSEKKMAEKKVDDIMSNLSELERELLMKSLGLRPEIDVDVVKNPTHIVPSTEETAIDGRFTIVMNDGNTRSIDNSWSEILGHLRQVALKRETVNISVFKYIADQMALGLTRKELIEALGSQHYAKRALDICSELGLYKLDRSQNAGKKRSPVASAKSGRTLSERSEIKKKVIEEDIKQKAEALHA